jgi:hypothetical protein
MNPSLHAQSTVLVELKTPERRLAMVLKQLVRKTLNYI